ncbi:MobC family plasmid mobilization relaxosome protein [Acetobacter aceti]|uniref:Uncharacterized protein n=1 Tax=Acetobacter aceti TaxID=435 RepID=A0A6S6PLA2_ACEAC|nr:MobC family plasmid mobilization relaxosome protein [Acetobacter aceti]BCI67431.1 hypothetical protein AAJCM20276_20550 [Acetobacter aceti]
MELKSKNIKVRIRPSEYKLIKEKSENISGYVRACVLDYSHNGPALSSELYELRKEINAIGNNVNQLAKRANQGEQVDISHLSETIEKIQKDINQRLVKIK